MATDRMYDLAFEFKKQKPWKKIPEEDHFAVLLPDSRIGYCVLTGSQGEHLALSVYIGEEAYQGILALLYDREPVTFLQEFEIYVRQDCLQCSLESKDFAPHETIDEVRDYAKRNGFRLGGANTFPSFLRFSPGRVPVRIEDKADEECICAALDAVMYLLEGYRHGAGRRLPEGFMYLLKRRKTEKPEEIPFDVDMIPAPEWKANYPEPVFRNDIGLAKLKKCRRTDSILCDAIHIPGAITDRDPPYYATMLLCVNNDTGVILPVAMAGQADEHPEQLVQALLESLLDAKCYPRSIRVMNRRTEALLTSFCKKAKIRLVLEERLEVLEEVEEDLTEDFRLAQDEDDIPDSVYEVIDLLSGASDDELLQLPREGVACLLQVREILPEELALRLERLFPD